MSVWTRRLATIAVVGLSTAAGRAQEPRTVTGIETLKGPPRAMRVHMTTPGGATGAKMLADMRDYISGKLETAQIGQLPSGIGSAQTLRVGVTTTPCEELVCFAVQVVFVKRVILTPNTGGTRFFMAPVWEEGKYGAVHPGSEAELLAVAERMVDKFVADFVSANSAP